MFAYDVVCCRDGIIKPYLKCDATKVIIENVGYKLVVDDNLAIFLLHECIFISMPLIGHKGRNCWPKGIVMRWAFLGKIYMHICVGKLTIIGSDNGLSPGRRQAIIGNNAGILLIGSVGINFSEIPIVIHTFSFRKMHLNMSSAKLRPFCLGLSSNT